MDGGRAETGEISARAKGAQQPRRKDRDGEHERESDDQRAEQHGRDSRVPQGDRPPSPAGAAAEAMNRRVASGAQLDDQDGNRDGDQQQRQQRRAASIQGRPVLDINRASEGIVAEQGDDPEITQGVEHRQYPAGRRRGTKLRQGDREEGPPGTVAETAGGLFQRWIEVPQRRAYGEIDVGIGEERQGQPRSGKPVDRGQPLDPQWRQRRLQHAAWPKRGDHHHGADIRRDHQRQRRGGAPERAPGKIGPARQPGQRYGDGNRRDRDGAGESRGVEHDFERPGPEQQAPSVFARVERPRDEVEQRQQLEQRDQHRRQHDPQRRPFALTARAGTRVALSSGRFQSCRDEAGKRVAPRGAGA